jgi:hypothetical protein
MESSASGRPSGAPAGQVNNVLRNEAAATTTIDFVKKQRRGGGQVFTAVTRCLRLFMSSMTARVGAGSGEVPGRMIFLRLPAWM